VGGRLLRASRSNCPDITHTGVPTPLPSVSLLLQVVLGGSKGGLFGTLNSDYGSAAAAAVMGRLAKMAARHMGNRGFSIGTCVRCFVERMLWSLF
jgi:hypothetical protein